MSAVAASARVGWCPGALRPMASGDGLIVRIKPRAGSLTPTQAIGIAAAAARFGNGALDLTSRANLQIRGVDDDRLPELTEALDDLGLLDGSPEAEARRNVLMSPLAGLDPGATFDIREAVAALEGWLADDVSLAWLPAKFGFAVSDGGRMPLDHVPTDVRFEAVLYEGRPAFEVGLDGEEKLVAVCAAPAMSDAAVRLARVFVGARRQDPDLHRMRDLVARDGAEAVFDRAGLVARVARQHRDHAETRAFVGFLTVSASVATQSSPSDAPPRLLRCFAPRNDDVGTGAHADPLSGPSDHSGSIEASRDGFPIPPGGEKGNLILGVAAAFGRLDATQFETLARGAAAAGASDLRLTPWRAILVPGLDAAAATILASACATAGLIVDPADPRLRVAACAGSPGCHRGTVSTLDHAARWARLAGPGQGIALHVSGCAKGCAHPGSAPLTLVGRDGRYDLVVDGRPGDAPTVLGLEAEEARRLIRTLQRRDARA